MLQYSKTEKCSVYQQIFTILPFLPLLKKEKKKKEKSTHDTTRHSILSDEKSIVDKTDVNAMIKYSRTGNHGRRFLDFAILVTLEEGGVQGVETRQHLLECRFSAGQSSF